MSYDTGIYAELAPLWGDRLWAFLGETPVLIIMLKASDAGLSPAAAIADDLTRRFGNAVQEKKVRDFTGYLVWQALERYLVVSRSNNSRSRELDYSSVSFVGMR